MADSDSHIPAIPDQTSEAGGSRPQRSGARQRLPFVMVGLVAGCLIFLVGLFWSELGKRFPLVEPGAYVGQVTGIAQDQDRQPLRFYLEHNQQTGSLFVVPLREGWLPQSFSAIAPPGAGGNLDPITMQGDGATLRLVGRRIGEGNYGGSAYGLESSESGVWQITKVTSDGGSSAQLGELRRALGLAAELQAAQRAVTDLEAQLAEQRAQSERLTEYLTEGKTLAADAEQQMRQARDELDQARGELQRQREKAEQLAAQVAVSEKVAGAGRLVALARESIERENRWIDSMLRVGLPEENTELGDALARATAIDQLEQEIATERATVRELQDRLVVRSPGEIKPFDSFWKKESEPQ